MGKIENIENEYGGLVDDKNLEIVELKNLLTIRTKELKELKSARLRELGIIKDEEVIKMFGSKLEKGQSYPIKYDDVPDEFRYKRGGGNEGIKFGKVQIYSDFTITINGETNLRYNIELLSDSNDYLLWSNTGTGTRQSPNFLVSMAKDKVFDFLTKSSKKVMRNYKLKELGL